MGPWALPRRDSVTDDGSNADDGETSLLYLAQLADEGSGVSHMDWSGGWWMTLFWAPFLIIGLAALLFLLFRSGSTSSTARREVDGDPLDDARKILADRYARGELDSGEYRERVEQLG